MGNFGRLLTLAVVATSALGATSAAYATTITGYGPGDGATLSAQPVFSISATNQNSGGQPFSVRVSADASGGELGGGYGLTIPGSGGSARLPVSLDPGTYYWQWTYTDYGCFAVLDPRNPFQLTQPDCHPDGRTTCPLLGFGHCIGPVLSFVVAAPSPPPPPPPSSPPPPPPPTSPAPTSPAPTLPPAPATPQPATPTPVAGPPETSSPVVRDTVSPNVRTLAATGRVHRSMRLRFRVSDDSGQVAVALGVFRGNRTVTRRALPFKAVSADRVYSVGWKPPLVGSYRFCVAAADAAGNHSGSCAAVTVHR
jgi:hypothetical protein